MIKNQYSNQPPCPRVLRIEPASQCNRACSLCPTGTIDMKRGLMTDDIFNKILSEIELHKNDIKVVVLYHGGEPLLNKSFFKYIDEIKRINSSFFIKTVSNGTGLTKKVSEKLLLTDIDSIDFSLDGQSASENEHIRIKSKTDIIINNIKYLIDLKKRKNLLKPVIFLASTQFIKDRNIVNPLDDPPVPDWIYNEFKENVKYKTTYAMKWPHMPASGEYEFVTLEMEMEDKNECDHVISTMTVRADGSVVPCCYDLTTKLNMGNVLTESLNEIWKDKKYLKLRESIKKKTFMSLCSKCNVVSKPPTYLLPKF